MRSENDIKNERGGVVSRMRQILDRADAVGRRLTSEERSEYQALDSKLDALNVEWGALPDTRGWPGGLSPQQRMGDPNEGPDGSTLFAPTFHRNAGQAVIAPPVIDAETRDTRNRAIKSFVRADDRQYVDAFVEYLVRGPIGMDNDHKRLLLTRADEMRALQADIDTAGGFLLPDSLMARVLMHKDEISVIRRHSFVVYMPTAHKISFPKLDNNPSDFLWTAELSSGGEDNDMDFQMVNLYPHPLAKRIKVSKGLLRLPSIDVAAFVRKRLAYVFATTEEQSFMTGSGSNQPLGIFVENDNGVSSSRDLETGVAGVLKADDLYNAEAMLKQQYRFNCRWLCGREFLKRVRKLKDGDGSYLWQPGLAAKPDTLLGFPVVASEFVPVTTASDWVSGAYVAALCDLSNYYIGESLNFSVQHLTELYAESNQDGFIARGELDGQPVDENGFVRIKLK